MNLNAQLLYGTLQITLHTLWYIVQKITAPLPDILAGHSTRA